MVGPGLRAPSKRTKRRESSSLASPSQHHSVVPTSPSNSTSEVQNRINNGTNVQTHTIRKPRGPTRGIKFAKKKQPGEKLPIQIPRSSNRVVGDNSQTLITQSGYLVRMRARLDVPKWSKIDEKERKTLLETLEEDFQIPDDANSKEVIYSQMKRQYRNYRHLLHKKFFKPYPTSELAKQHRPLSISQETWDLLCDYFDSPEYKAISARNKANRAKQDSLHSAGTKSFARICYDMRDLESGKELGQIKLYQVTHIRTNGSWVNEHSKQNFEKMEELCQTQLQNEDATPMTEEEICLEVLGYKSGYIRGRGAGPKPIPSYRNQYFRIELDEAKRRADIAEQRAADFAMEIENMRTMQTEMQAKQKEQDQLLRMLMEQLRTRGSILVPQSCEVRTCVGSESSGR